MIAGQSRQIVAGLATYLPASIRKPATTRSPSGVALYSYAVWMRHLILARQSGLDRHPEVVVELGPGDSLGAGLAALLSGSGRLISCDVERWADPGFDAQVVDELAVLYRQRMPIPGPESFPRLSPSLETYAFPNDVLTDDQLSRSVAPARLEEVRAALMAGDTDLIRYETPVSAEDIATPGVTADLVFSQAVLEYVENPHAAYRTMRQVVAPGGVISHQIDLSAHQTSSSWDGHWATGDFIWQVMRGNRGNWLNRLPASAHMGAVDAAGFRVTRAVRNRAAPSGRKLQARFRSLLQPEDLQTKGLYFVASGIPVDNDPTENDWRERRS